MHPWKSQTLCMLSFMRMPWDGTRPFVARGANNARDGPGLARVLNGLRGPSMRRDLTENAWLNL